MILCKIFSIAPTTMTYLDSGEFGIYFNHNELLYNIQKDNSTYDWTNIKK